MKTGGFTVKAFEGVSWMDIRIHRSTITVFTMFYVSPSRQLLGIEVVQSSQTCDNQSL
jgi:hypothetical protein